MMSFQLCVVDTETGHTVEMEFSDSDRELLTRQKARCVTNGGLELFAQWLSLAVGTSLPTVVDYELRPPSEAQVNFATAIARALALALPPEVLRYRGAMHDFLSSHKEAFDARRRSGVKSEKGTIQRSDRLSDDPAAALNPPLRRRERKRVRARDK